MRILITTRGSAGHLLPLAPFAEACVRAGHEVLVAAQAQNRRHVERAGLPFAPVGDPPAEEWVPLMSRFATLDQDTANAVMVGEFFGGIDTRAALPDQLAIVDSWQPDLLIRESWEVASTIVSELRGLPLARVGLGLAAVEDFSLRVIAPVVDKIRIDHGLPADPAGDRLRAAPYFTMLPEAIELSTAAIAPSVRRYRPEPSRTQPSLPDWWSGNDDPLVYLTFGSVTAAQHLPYYPALYQAAIEAVAALPVRLLVTIGEARDLAELGPVPSNVHLETWVPNDAVTPRADAVVCHGGYGSTFGTLAHEVPLVVLPLFSMDQQANADAVSHAGAGIAVTDEPRHGRAMGLPDPATIAALGPAVQHVLADKSFRTAAQQVAEAVRALPPVDAAVDAFAGLARTRRR